MLYFLHEDCPVVFISVRADSIARHGGVGLVQLDNVEGGKRSGARLGQDPTTEPE